MTSKAEQLASTTFETDLTFDAGVDWIETEHHIEFQFQDKESAQKFIKDCRLEEYSFEQICEEVQNELRGENGRDVLDFLNAYAFVLIEIV